MATRQTVKVDAPATDAVRRRAFMILGGLTVAVIVGLLLAPEIRQDQGYHSFADNRAIFELPNFFNVVSNVPFFFVGVAGLMMVGRKNADFSLERGERWAYMILFAGVALTCFGSGYYHAAPDDKRLVWDRLPMTLGFMSFFAATISERISIRAGTLLLLPLVVAGAASVAYWDLTGDLRPYVAVQFYPLVAIPLISLMFNSRYTRGSDIVLIIGLYAAAKVLELLDGQIYSLGQLVSGHSLKHLAAAGAAWAILRMVTKRQPAAT